jgi:hypothetical protein
MSKERELIKAMKILLECTYMDSRQRQADTLIGRAIELLAQPEHKEEPVAWMYDWEDTIQKVSMQNRMTRIKAISERPEAFNIRPLYLAPPKREPLSFGEIEDGRDNNKSYGYTCGFEDGVRWAEQQHGIGGE